MYCENCGKKLIRGYQFCMECGTPVPPETEEEENEDPRANDQPSEEQPSGEMPGIRPLGNDEGTLVFCPTCGMRMQKSTDYCEKCGMKLNSNGSSGVPLVNTDPIGGEFGEISDSDIARIDNFVNNSGLGGNIGYDASGSGDIGGLGGLGGDDLSSEIEALNRQFANLNSTSSDMPEISASVPEPEPEPVRVSQEPDLGSLSRKVDDFSMEAGMPETHFFSESGLPVINGGEMTEPDVPVQLEQNYDDINIDVIAPAPAYTESEAPAYTEPETSAYTEPEVPAYTEPETSAYTESSFTQPRRPEHEPTDESSEEADLGKLVYCRNCGQDMYEKEAVCKNCGSPNKWNIKPLKKNVSGVSAKKEKQTAKLFGVIPLPTVIGAAVVVVGIIALVVFTSTAKKSDDMISKPATPTTAATTSSKPVEADENSAANVSDVSGAPEEINPIVTNESLAQPISEETVQSETAEDVTSDNDSRPSNTTSGENESAAIIPAVTTRATASNTTKVNTVTTKAVSTTKQTTVTTKSSVAAVSAKPTATVTNEDKQREKILDAFEAVSAEVGKLHLYSQATGYAVEAGFTKTKFTSEMTSVLSGGKSSVSNLVKNAKPSSSELSGAYSSLWKLYDLYTDYYTYVIDSSDSGAKYASTADSKLSSFNSSAKNGLGFKSLQTKNQTDSDKSRQYADMLSNASAAASNAVSQFTTVKNSVANLKSSKYESDVMDVIYNDNTSAIMKAAGYAQIVSNYDEMMSGAPSEYTSAKSSLTKAASDIDGMLGVFIDAAYNDLSGFKSEFNSYKTSVDKLVSAINKAI